MGFDGCNYGWLWWKELKQSLSVKEGSALPEKITAPQNKLFLQLTWNLPYQFCLSHHGRFVSWENMMTGKMRSHGWVLVCYGYETSQQDHVWHWLRHYKPPKNHNTTTLLAIQVKTKRSSIEINWKFYRNTSNAEGKVKKKQKKTVKNIFSSKAKHADI